MLTSTLRQAQGGQAQCEQDRASSVRPSDRLRAGKLSANRTGLRGFWTMAQSRVFLFCFEFFAGCFVGLPTGRGRTRRPSSFSSLLRKLSVPSGLPVWVLARRRVRAVSSIFAFNCFRQRSGEIMPYHRGRLSNSDCDVASMCAAALDHSYRQGLRQIFARTGLSSTYLIASQKCGSSRGHE